MNPEQFIRYIIEPTLKEINLYSRAATRLLLGTAMVESSLAYVRQVKGPALGLYQMEPDTHDDTWHNFLQYKPELARRIRTMTVDCDAEDMVWNLRYATAMARVHYLRVKEPLPKANDAVGMATYHKNWYNTPLGKTVLTKSLPVFERALNLGE